MLESATQNVRNKATKIEHGDKRKGKIDGKRWIEAERKGNAEKEEKGPLNEEEGVDVISVVLPDVQHHYTAFFEAARSSFLSSFGRCVDVTATKQIPLLKTRNVQNSDRSGFIRPE
ncbi:hypothetical protein K0M31_001725 [Melipona bicolor]|uniref:Uncharacterized protein n=1 Tax=Melipona bicolor TaxID=60889 RepID=A0AA40GG50_9HYME|nr:hypothetical protein K0M31_001725 [Melipona bicolor]